MTAPDSTTAVESVDRGRAAESPTEIPAEGWKDVLARVKAESKQDRIMLLSAGVAFFWTAGNGPGVGSSAVDLRSGR